METKQNINTFRFRLALNLLRKEFAMYVRLRQVLKKKEERFWEKSMLYKAFVERFDELIKVKLIKSYFG